MKILIYNCCVFNNKFLKLIFYSLNIIMQYNIDNNCELIYCKVMNNLQNNLNMNTNNDTDMDMDISYTNFSLNENPYDEESYSSNDESIDDYDCDYDCNYDNNNTNDCVQDIFHYEIEKAIDSGNINLIKNAITNYQHLIDKSYIIWANNIMFQMVQEQIENITLC